jgi:hypothetical protein
MSPILYRSTRDNTRYLVPLNCGLSDERTAIAIELKITGADTYQRVDCGEMKIFPLQAQECPPGWELLGRKRICIEHRVTKDWLGLDARMYTVAFEYSGNLYTSTIQSFGATTDFHDTSAEYDAYDHIGSGAFVPMTFGRFLAARFVCRSARVSFVFGVAVRRCDDTLTIQCWKDEPIDSFTQMIDSLRGYKPIAGTRTDFVELDFEDGSCVRVQLRPRGWPTVRSKDDAGSRAFVVEIAHIASRKDLEPRYQEHEDVKAWRDYREA